MTPTEVETTDIWPEDLRPGMGIKDGRVSIPVKNVGPCPGSIKGRGRTHVNDAFCYDNAAKVTIRV